MKMLAFNGSPRKNGNTAIFLKKALQGAELQGAYTELINLYDFDYKGCTSCLACKTTTSKSYGKCALRDTLTPLLKKIEEADAIILGSPIYFGRVTAAMAAFYERLVYPYLAFTKPYYSSLYPKKMPVGFIYDMNVTEDISNELGYMRQMELNDSFLKIVFGHSEFLNIYDTRQVEDFSNLITYGDYEYKLKHYNEEFSKDCQKASELGVRLASNLN